MILNEVQDNKEISGNYTILSNMCTKLLNTFLNDYFSGWQNLAKLWLERPLAHSAYCLDLCPTISMYINTVCSHSYLILHHVSGKDQVMVGLVTINTPFSSSQSCKAVFPLAIANCKETRLVYVNFTIYKICLF